LANNLYLFYGDERLTIEERINKLKKPGLTVENIDGNKLNLEEILTALQTLSLFAQEKIVLVKDADLKDSVWDGVVPALENLSPGVVVIIWAGSMNKRSQIYKTINKLGQALEFKTFADWEQDKVVSWITNRVKSEGKKIGQQAAFRLQEVCGSSLQKLSSEIEKLVTYIGEKPLINEADVETLASPGEINVFALSEAVANRNLPLALTTFRTLSINKTEVIPVLSLLAGQFRTMLLTKHTTDLGSLGLSPYYVKKCARAAGKYKEVELRKNLELILETDLKLKTGENQQTTFELLLTDLCN